MNLEKVLLDRTVELCPDYPNVETCGPFEHVWALTSALAGVRMACDDWKDFVLEEFGEEAYLKAVKSFREKQNAKSV